MCRARPGLCSGGNERVGDDAPGGEALGAGPATGGSGRPPAAQAAVVHDRAICGGAAPVVAGAREPAPPPLAFADRPVGVSRPVVQPLVAARLDARQQHVLRGPLARQRVGERRAWDSAPPFLGGRRDVTAARPSMPLETGSRCLRLVRWHGHSTARWRDPATTNAAPRSRPDRQPREERQAGGGARRPGPGRDASRLQGGDAASRHGVIQVCPGAAQRADAAMRGARRLVGHGGVPATPVGVADAPRAGAARAARLQGHFRARVVGQRPAVHAARVDGQGAPALRRGDICAIADPQAIPSRRPGAARDRVRLGRARRLGDRRAHPPAAAADHARRAQQPRHPLMRAAHPGRAARGVDPWGTSGPATPRVGGEHGERLARSPARGAPPRTGTPAGTAGRYASSDTSSSRTISPGIRITQAIPDAMNAESSAR